MKVTGICILAIALFLFLPVFICEPQETNPPSTLERGIGQYKHENYDEALILLKQARQVDPSSTLAAYYLGLDYKQLQDYHNAIPNLKDAVAKEPKIIGALIELIDCLYQVGELEDSLRWVAVAEKEGIRPAQVAFLKGLVLLKQDNDQEAIAAFEKAKLLDKTMEQSSDYQIGIAHLKAKEFDFAQEAFKEVLLLEPSSNMAIYANEYLDAIAKRTEAMRPWKLSAGVAWQYDDNVVLKPDEASAAVAISDKATSRQVYTTNLEYTHQYTQRFGLNSQYLFYFAKQNELGYYNTMAHSLVIQPNIYFQRSLLSFPATYTHTLVHESSYLSNPAFNTIYNFMVGDKQMGQVFVQYGNKNYLWTSSTSDEDRDGNGLRAGLGWYLFFAKKKGFFNIRYEADKEWAKGTNWEYFGNQVSSTLAAPVTDKLKVTLSGSALFQKFSHTHTVLNVRRSDTVYTLSSLAAYEFYKNCELQAQYTYIKDGSNISVYAYNRNITSIGFKFNF